MLGGLLGEGADSDRIGTRSIAVFVVQDLENAGGFLSPRGKVSR